VDAGPGVDAGQDGGAVDAGIDGGGVDGGGVDSGGVDSGGVDAGDPPSPPVLQVAVGFDHVCARTLDRRVYCWGANGFGQLGDGTTIDRSSPTLVPTLTDVAFVGAGDRGTCARTTAGDVYCWGNNGEGENGDGTTVTRSSPVRVTLPGAATFLVRGWSHNCALVGGVLQCWGASRFLGLQDATMPALSPIPLSVPEAPIRGFAISGPTLVTAGASVYAWGTNANGELGDGTTVDRAAPTAVIGLDAMTSAVAAGAFHGCARIGAEVRCWGHNPEGEVGNGNTITPVTSPVAVVLSGAARDLAVGFQHSCAILTDDTVKCWGRNDFGEVGNGTTVPQPTPVAVGGLSGVFKISTGQYTTCAIVGTMASTDVRCWGRNDHGQLGDGTTTNSSVPVSVLF
jgi:alpha-tubulin suppressor-like RCC1 family protein